MSRFSIPKDDKHPRSKKMYQQDMWKRHDMEKKEYGGSDGTPIIHGDWKLIVHTGTYSNALGYRRYHRHGKRWYCVISYSTSSLPREEYPWENKWKCGHCGEHVPDEMEGYINLARWATGEG